MKAFIYTMRNFLFRLLRPRYWILNDPYNPLWDLELNLLLDIEDFRPSGLHTHKLGSVSIWTSNIPYSCMAPWGDSDKGLYRASAITIERATRKFKRTEIARITAKYKNTKED